MHEQLSSAQQVPAGARVWCIQTGLREAGRWPAETLGVPRRPGGWGEDARGGAHKGRAGCSSEGPAEFSALRSSAPVPRGF